MFDFILRKDEKLASIEKTIPDNAKFTSPEIQNSIIDFLASMVTQSVAEDVQASDPDCFCLFVDGTRDKNRRENLSIAVRFVKDGQPQEALLNMPSTDDLGAEAIANLLVKNLKISGIECSKMIAQCYDGANCMSGAKGGVQRRIQEILGKEIPYVHCMNHRLHLVVVDLLKLIPALRLYFEQVEMIYLFFSKFKVNEMYEGRSLKKVIDTRWSGHYDSVTAIVANYTEVIDCIQAISHSMGTFDGETVVTANGLLALMNTITFKFCSLMMKTLLGILKPADSALQARQTDIVEALVLIDTTAEILRQKRTEDTFNELHNEASQLTHVTYSQPKRRRVVNRRLADFFVTEGIGGGAVQVEDEEKCLKMLYFEAIDVITCEIARRFQHNSWLYQAIAGISRKTSEANNFLNAKVLQPLTRLGIKIPSEAELEVCRSYLKTAAPIQEKDDPNFVLRILYINEKMLFQTCTDWQQQSQHSDPAQLCVKHHFPH